MTLCRKCLPRVSERYPCRLCCCQPVSFINCVIVAPSTRVRCVSIRDALVSGLAMPPGLPGFRVVFGLCADSLLSFAFAAFAILVSIVACRNPELDPVPRQARNRGQGRASNRIGPLRGGLDILKSLRPASTAMLPLPLKSSGTCEIWSAFDARFVQ